MKDEDLDRLLSGSPLPDPGPAFTRKVMAEVRREAAALPPIPFPWPRLAIGLGLAVALLVANLVVMPPAHGPAVAPAAIPGALGDAGWLRPALLASVALFVSWLGLRVTAIFSGARC